MENRSTYERAAQKCLDRYDFGPGLKLAGQPEWELDYAEFPNPISSAGAARMYCGIDLIADDSSPPIRADFWVIFDIDPATGESSANKPTTIFAVEPGQRVPLGSPVGMPRFFKARVVVDVLVFAHIGDIGVTVPKAPMDMLDCTIAYMEGDVREEWKSCMGTVDVSGWEEIPESEASSFAASLDDSLEYYGSPEGMMKE
jgi:hypothetical protein